MTASSGPPAAAGDASFDTSDEALVRSMPGFRNGYAQVNGVRLHYVVGGRGAPLVLLPGHCETWWAYHHVMSLLADAFTLIAVDIRGMGGSDKPRDGYDKKTMARDVHELTRALGYDAVNVAGHDIGAMVAFSFAANHPEATRKLALLDVPHPDESWYRTPMLPQPGQFGAKVDAEHPPYAWWFAFHQVRGLPERLLAGDGMRAYIAWHFDYMLDAPHTLAPLDAAVYGDAYSPSGAVRAGCAWYQAWPQDITDQKAYAKLTMPVLGIGGEYTGAKWLQIVKDHATDFTLTQIDSSGHYFMMESPELTARLLRDFFA